MCTAATYRTDDFYMGRTLDYEFSYGEEITVMPRNFPLSFRHGGGTDRHYAIIGMAHVADGYPMYYDAVNEKGLGMAGLNFAASARYSEPEDGKQNVAQFEFIPWVLSQFASLGQARSAIEKINLVGTTYDSRYPAAKMHWIIADKSGAITVEPTEGGLKIYDNAPGVLTNEPPFDMQLLISTTICASRPGSRKTAFRTPSISAHTAAVWADWVCPATYPRCRDSSEPRSPSSIRSPEAARRRASVSSSISSALSSRCAAAARSRRTNTR